MYVSHDIGGAVYERFIRYALSHSDAFMLVVHHVDESCSFNAKKHMAMCKETLPEMPLTPELVERFLAMEREDGQWNKDMQAHIPPFIQRLEPFLIKQRHNPMWPCTTAYPPPGITYDINLYRADPAILPILLSAEHYFGWRNPFLPEDLCFFRGNRCWALGCSHEESISLFPADLDEYRALCEMGVEFFDEPEFDDPQTLFFEEY